MSVSMGDDCDLKTAITISSCLTLRRHHIRHLSGKNRIMKLYVIALTKSFSFIWHNPDYLIMLHSTFSR
jgi:hypothetical protein